MAPDTGFTEGGTPVTATAAIWPAHRLLRVHPGQRLGMHRHPMHGHPPAADAAGPEDVHVISEFEDTSPTTSADVFTYTVRPAPTITAVLPASGTDEGWDTVTITGTDLDGGTVDFGANAANSQTCTATSCVAASPVSEDTDADPVDGPVDITVTTSAGTSAVSSADRFAYHRPGGPTVTAVSPSSGSVVGGTTITATGTNLTNGEIFVGDQVAGEPSCTVTAGTVDVPPATSGRRWTSP